MDCPIAVKANDQELAIGELATILGLFVSFQETSGGTPVARIQTQEFSLEVIQSAIAPGKQIANFTACLHLVQSHAVYEYDCASNQASRY